MAVAGKVGFSPERCLEVYQDLAESVLTVALEDVDRLYKKVEGLVLLDIGDGLLEWVQGEMLKNPVANDTDVIPLPTRYTFDVVEFFAPGGWGRTLMAFCGIAEVPDVLTRKIEVLRRYLDSTYPQVVRYRQTFVNYPLLK